MSKTCILTADQIERKLQRMAREILEVHAHEAEIALVGIAGQGVAVAERLGRIVRSIAPEVQVQHLTLTLHKPAPETVPAVFSGPTDLVQGRSAVVVDDVLNSGRTLLYAVRSVLDAGAAQITAAVLVDRIHRRFPVRADICGLSLSTTLKEHIEVQTAAEGPAATDAAYLVD
jgi:pyrimidine operon attenuation protein/uracil phosphoribosyltransferase